MDSELNMRQYCLVIRRWLWLVAGCTLLAAISAYAVSSRVAQPASEAVSEKVFVPKVANSGKARVV